MSWQIRVLLALVLSGWVVPLWAAVNQVLIWAIGNLNGRIDSFPHLGFAKTSFLVAMIWLLISCTFVMYLMLNSTSASGANSR
jgi:hypothetical protein